MVDDAIRAAITRTRSAGEIRALAARGGMTTLLQNGILKAIAGQTDLRQVLAACGR